jgi:hypothetical protein
MTEIEQVKAEIKMLEKKLSFLEEIEKQPQMTLQQEGDYDVVSYNNTTYYRLMGEVTFSWYIKKGVSATYPFLTLVMVNDAETERLLDGLYYNHIQVKKEKEERLKEDIRKSVRESVKWCEENPDKDPLDWLKPQTPEQVADGLKEAFREAVKQGVVSSANKPKDDFMDKMVAELKGTTLTDLIHRWWEDVFTTHSDWDSETSIADLVDQIELFLPREQNASGSQNAYVECTVEGFNDCLNKIKRKLR